MVNIIDFKQEDWVDIYENLDEDGHLNEAGKQQLKNMQRDQQGG